MRVWGYALRAWGFAINAMPPQVDLTSKGRGENNKKGRVQGLPASGMDSRVRGFKGKEEVTWEYRWRKICIALA